MKFVFKLITIVILNVVYSAALFEDSNKNSEDNAKFYEFFISGVTFLNEDEVSASFADENNLFLANLLAQMSRLDRDKIKSGERPKFFKVSYVVKETAKDSTTAKPTESIESPSFTLNESLTSNASVTSSNAALPTDDSTMSNDWSATITEVPIFSKKAKSTGTLSTLNENFTDLFDRIFAFSSVSIPNATLSESETTIPASDSKLSLSNETMPNSKSTLKKFSLRMILPDTESTKIPLPVKKAPLIHPLQNLMPISIFKYLDSQYDLKNVKRVFKPLQDLLFQSSN